MPLTAVTIRAVRWVERGWRRMRCRFAVVVLVAGACGPAPDPSGGPTWFPSTSVPDVVSDSAVVITQIATDQPGLVAVGWTADGGTDRGVVWASPDAITWTAAEPPRPTGAGGQEFRAALTTTDALLVAGQDAGRAAISYQDRSSGVWTTSTLAAPEPGVLFALAEIGGVLVAGGTIGRFGGGEQRGAIWTSTDGSTWNPSRDNASFDHGGSAAVKALRVIDGTIFAVGRIGSPGQEQAAVWSSSDGLGWTGPAVLGPGIAQDIARAPDGTLVTAGLTDIATPNHTDGEDAAVWTSTDQGHTWTRSPHDEEILGGPGNQVIWALEAVGNHVLAAGWTHAPAPWNAATWMSEDGVNWQLGTPPTAPTPETAQGVHYIGILAGQLLAAGRDIGQPPIWVAQIP